MFTVKRLFDNKKVEISDNLIGLKVELMEKYKPNKNEDYIGVITGLWLEKIDDIQPSGKPIRGNHLWYVDWFSGKRGLIEKKEVKILK